MKFEDAKKLKVGDKVVVKVKEYTWSDHSRDAHFNLGSGSYKDASWVCCEDILGKLSDFQQQKIKFTEAEKEEFDGLTNYFSTPWAILNCIEKYHGGRRSNLYNRIFHSGSNAENAAAQFEFVKAIEHPELIEVEKEKKYRLKIFGECYLAHDDDGKIHMVYKPGADEFTQSEIDKLQKLPEFSAINLNKCKEEITHDIH